MENNGRESSGKPLEGVAGMNTSIKCNCCIKESVCKYKVEYGHDCKSLMLNINGRTTEIEIKCKEFMPKSTARELHK